MKSNASASPLHRRRSKVGILPLIHSLVDLSFEPRTRSFHIGELCFDIHSSVTRRRQNFFLSDSKGQAWYTVNSCHSCLLHSLGDQLRVLQLLKDEAVERVLASAKSKPFSNHVLLITYLGQPTCQRERRASEDELRSPQDLPSQPVLALRLRLRRSQESMGSWTLPSC